MALAPKVENLPQELYEIVKYIGSAALGAGLTIAVIAKFGESVFFKHLDHKYAEKLAHKKIQSNTTRRAGGLRKSPRRGLKPW